MGLIPVPDAARMLGLEPKRFLGYCMRNGLGDPISDGQMVYGWSCAQLAERLAAIKSVVQP